jgi:hypothetical protein
MLKSLTIRTPEGTVVAMLSWHEDMTVAEWCSPRLKADVARWIDDGLDEWVGEGVEAVPRSTPSSAPEFLDRLEAYLCRQFPFVTSKDSTDNFTVNRHAAAEQDVNVADYELTLRATMNERGACIALDNLFEPARANKPSELYIMGETDGFAAPASFQPNTFRPRDTSRGSSGAGQHLVMPP